MKYIPLDEVEKLFEKYIKHSRDYEYNTISISLFASLWEEISSFKSIDLSIIDEMIEKNKKSSDYMNEKLVWPARENILKELKERLSLNK